MSISTISSMVYRISLESKVHYLRLLFWSRKLETRARDANIHIADRNQPRLSRKWRREGKGRRIIKVVDSSFRFTRVVRFASATGQFFSCHASRWFLVRRYPRDLWFQAYVHTCISLFLKSIRPWWRLFNQLIVRSPRVPFLTPSYPSFFLPDFSNRVSFMGEKWNRVEKWTRWNVNVARKTKFSYNL